MEIREVSVGAMKPEQEGVLPLFVTDFWSGVAPEGYKRLGVFSGKNADELIAVFAIFQFQKLGKRILISPPVSPHCGLVLLQQPLKKYTAQTAHKRVLRQVCEYLEKTYPKDYIDVAFPAEIKDVQPFQQEGFQIEISYTYLVDLQNGDEDSLLMAMSPERRKNIRDALSSTLRVSINPPMEAVLNLIKSTLSEQGVAPPLETLGALLTGGSDRVFSIGVFDGDQMTATAIIGMDARRAHYLAGGTQKTSAAAGPLSLWEAIKESKKRGAKEFDFLGSSVPAIERYFRAFGGELTPYFRIRRNTALVDFLKSTKERFH
jgi:hypothetical protein